MVPRVERTRFPQEGKNRWLARNRPRRRGKRTSFQVSSFPQARSPKAGLFFACRPYASAHGFIRIIPRQGTTTRGTTNNGLRTQHAMARRSAVRGARVVHAISNGENSRRQTVDREKPTANPGAGLAGLPSATFSRPACDRIATWSRSAGSKIQNRKSKIYDSSLYTPGNGAHLER
jgi:hypothetical protein